MAKQKSNLPIFFILAIFIIVLDLSQILSPFHRVVDAFTVPFKSSLWEFSLVVRTLPFNVDKIRQINELREDNDELKRTLKEKEIVTNNLTQENEDLRKQLESPLPASYHFTAAKVIGVSEAMDIEGGSDEGITPGMPVVVGNTLVGKIETVNPTRSRVTLLSDPKIQVKAITSKNTKGIIGGKLGTYIKLDSVLQKDILLLEDIVTTSGEDGLPPSLLIGTVKRILSDDVSLYKSSGIDLSYNPYLSRTVFVITKK